jgi:hypothetical protein
MRRVCAKARVLLHSRSFPGFSETPFLLFGKKSPMGGPRSRAAVPETFAMVGWSTGIRMVAVDAHGGPRDVVGWPRIGPQVDRQPLWQRDLARPAPVDDAAM